MTGDRNDAPRKRSHTCPVPGWPIRQDAIFQPQWCFSYSRDVLQSLPSELRQLT